MVTRCCHFCQETTRDVCMCCRLPVCERCGAIQYHLFVHPGIDGPNCLERRLPMLWGTCQALAQWSTQSSLVAVLRLACCFRTPRRSMGPIGTGLIVSSHRWLVVGT